MLVAWFGGFGPGLLAAALCTVALAVFWIDPTRHIVQTSVDLFLFFVIAVAISALIESLRRARARADAAARAREQVLAVVAHDLRNPLAAIQLTSSSLQANTPDEATLRKRLSAIDRSAVRMDNLIRDLIDVTRIERGEIHLTRRPEPVESIVSETADMFAAITKDRDLTLTTAAPPASVSVACDRERIVQVLGNLIGNAMRFTPGGGRISLHASEQPGGVRFVVEDTGPGIRPTDLSHIFEPYWHTDSKGTGLGLYIAQSLIRGHGSQIEVASELGQGARFSFVLPRA
jgi:signal transduction histidine kinase